MNRSKLNAKHQATFPKEIRDMLNLTPGDSVYFIPCEDGCAVINKAESLDSDYYQTLLKTLEMQHREE